jgi:hypothetical protein
MSATLPLQSMESILKNVPPEIYLFFNHDSIGLDLRAVVIRNIFV